MYRLFNKAHYDFIGNRRKAYLFSAIMLMIGLAAALYNQSARGSWAKYGVDFTGGSVLQVQVPAADDAGDLRGVVGSVIDGAEITSFGDEANEYLIRTPGTGEDEATAVSEAVVAALQQQFGEDGVEVVRTEAVGAKVGGELQTRALIAILISLAATLIYLAFRFEWRFGLAAVVATAHDILMTMGLISLLRLEVSLTMIAAMLTIVGYSLNDTIIIFDRIRENLKTERRADFVHTINRSINETLPRTVLTSATTIVTLLALFMFGGEITREFALILIVGIVLGTYSSIFTASPVLLEIEKRWPREVARVKRARTTPTRPARA